MRRLIRQLALSTLEDTIYRFDITTGAIISRAPAPTETAVPVESGPRAPTLAAATTPTWAPSTTPSTLAQPTPSLAPTREAARTTAPDYRSLAALGLGAALVAFIWVGHRRRRT